MSNLKIPLWLKASLFPILNGLTVSSLCIFLSSHLSDIKFVVICWGLGGIFVGTLMGFYFEWACSGCYFSRKTSAKKFALLIIIILELGFGLALIVPIIWILLKFTPPSYQHSICCETPIDYGAIKYENFHLITSDEANISGWYVEPTIQRGKVIILIHGALNDRRGTEWYTRILIKAGYGVVLYDLRDNGESTGKLNIFNIMSVLQSDLKDVVKYIREKPEVTFKGIGIVGISMGAYVTLNTGTSELNNFSALWLDGLRGENFGSLLEFEKINDPLMAALVTPLLKITEFFSGQEIPSKVPAFSEILPQITMSKVMIVASGLDESEFETNSKLMKFADGNKYIWIIPNAWHIGGKLVTPTEYREKLLAFFQEAFAEK